MSVIFDTSAYTNKNYADTTVAATVNISEGTNLIIATWFIRGQNTTFSGSYVKFDNTTAMTKLSGTSFSGAELWEQFQQTWYMINPPAGSHNVTAYTGYSYPMSITVSTYKGVDTSSPFGDKTEQNNSYSSGQGIYMTVPTTPSNGMVYGAVGAANYQSTNAVDSQQYLLGSGGLNYSTWWTFNCAKTGYYQTGYGSWGASYDHHGFRAIIKAAPSGHSIMWS